MKEYKIIIPKQEQKYPIGGYAPGNYSCTCVTCKIKFTGDKRAVQCEPCAIKMTKQELTYTEAAKKEERIFNSNIFNQETLEEAAEKYVKDSSHELYELRKQCFLDGANWQAERMYSENEVKHLIHQACHHSGVSIFNRFDKWFKNFKKK